MITTDLVCRSCSTELDTSRVQLGLFTCIKCSDTEKYSAHIVYPHKTGAIVQPVQEDTKRNLQRLDRRSSNGGRTAKGIFADNSWDRWLDNYYNSYIKLNQRKKSLLKIFKKSLIWKTTNYKNSSLKISSNLVMTNPFKKLTSYIHKTRYHLYRKPKQLVN